MSSYLRVVKWFNKCGAFIHLEKYTGNGKKDYEDTHMGRELFLRYISKGEWKEIVYKTPDPLFQNHFPRAFNYSYSSSYINTLS